MSGWREWRDLLAETHIAITPEDRRVSEKYRVPVEIVATLKGDKERLGLALAVAEDRELAQLVAYKMARFEVLGVPAGVSVSNGSVVVRFRSGLKVSVPDDVLGVDDPVEILNLFRDYVLVRVRRGRGLAAERVTRIVPRADVELAERVAAWLEEHGYRPGLYYAALLALNLSPELPPGYVYDMMARMLPAVNERVHSIYLTRPGVGKTFTAMIYRHALAWTYFPKPPTPASLVGDARTGTITAIKHNGVWLDEFDKWSRGTDKQRLADAIEIMLSGLENCEWVREAGGALAPRATKCVPFIVSGNILPVVNENPRDIVKSIIGEVAEGAADAFQQRFAVAVLNKAVRAVRIVDHGLAGLTPRAAYVRGVFAVWRDRLNRLGGPVHGGQRMARHRENVKRTIMALGVDAEGADKLAYSLVEGVTVTGEMLAGGGE